MIHIFSNLRLRKRKTFRVHHIHWFPVRTTTWWSSSPSWSRRRPLTSSSSSPFSPSWFRKRPTWWWSTTFSLFFSREKTSNVSKFVWEIVLIYEQRLCRTSVDVDVGVDEKATTDLKEPTSITERQKWTRSHQDKQDQACSRPLLGAFQDKSKGKGKVKWRKEKDRWKERM